MLLLLIHTLKSSTKNSENGLLIETQLEKHFTCDIAPIKSRIRYQLCSIWGTPNRKRKLQRYDFLV